MNINPKNKIVVNSGDKYQHLTIIKEVEKDHLGRRKFLCKCDCGNEKEVLLMQLRNGAAVTCGCHKWNGLQTDVSEYIGKRYNKLVVVEDAGKDEHNRPMVKCICDCGNETTTLLKYLKNGDTKSCGCLKHHVFDDHNFKHGLTPRDFNDYEKRIYIIWRNMRRRCNNESDQAYNHYGGRGIVVCEDWNNDYALFREWAVSNGYSPELTIDRIDVNGNYCPENCRWVTMKEQTYNKRNTVYIEYQGERHTFLDWSKITGIRLSILKSRYRQGEPFETMFDLNVGSEHRKVRKAYREKQQIIQAKCITA